MNCEPIAIVGMGLRFPEANNPAEFWEILEQRRDVTKEIPEDRFSKEFWCSKTKFKGSSISFRGAFVDDILQFDAPFFNLSASEAKQLDPQIRLMLEAAWFAIDDAGLVIDKDNRFGGVFIGHMTHDYMEILDQDRYTITSHTMQGNAETMAANRISYFFNVTGPSETVNTACSSSLVAIHNAASAIRNRECDWAMAGGANALLDPRYFVGFTDWGTMSADGHSFSFDARANGYVRSEGAGMVILKRLSDAEQNGDRIYAVIRGDCVNHDGNKPAITNPLGETQSELMNKVYRDAHVDVSTVSFVEAHGTGTVAGDKTEADAISASLCPPTRSNQLLIGSLKSNFGHLEGAAGVAGLMKAALTLHFKRIPANIKLITPNPKIEWEKNKIRVPLVTEQFPRIGNHPRRVGVNSFGIGGTNVHIFLEEYIESKIDTHVTDVVSSATANMLDIHNPYSESLLPDAEISPTIPVNERCQPIQATDPSTHSRLHILSFTAKNHKQLVSIAERLFVQWNQENESGRESMCWTLMNRRTLLETRVSIVGTTDEIASGLDSLIKGNSSPHIIQSTSLEHQHRPICFVFCGQGAQWKDMGMSLMNIPGFETYRDCMNRCRQLISEMGHWDLFEEIKSDRVNTTKISQPATTAVQLSLVCQLRQWNIHPSAVVGHSSGEVAAAFVAGALDFDAAVRVAFYRGSCITEKGLSGGSMAAIGLSKEEAEKYLRKYPKLTIGCYNSPESLTISGDEGQINQMQKEFEEHGLFFRKLVVTHAFHSSHMHPAMDQYKQSIHQYCSSNLHSHSSRVPKCRFFSSLLAEEVTDLSSFSSDYFVRNLTNPVRFAEAARLVGESNENMCYVEIGPHPTMGRAVQQSLPKENNIRANCFGTLQRKVSDDRSMLVCIANLFCCGANTQKMCKQVLTPSPIYSKLPQYPFDRKALWLDSEESYRFRHPVITHPFLGIRMMNPEPVWERMMDMETVGWVQDHDVAGSTLAPGALFLDMAMSAGQQFFKSEKICLYDCSFLQALILPHEGPIHVRTTLKVSNGEVNIFHRDEPSDVSTSFTEEESKRWVLHFRCYVRSDLESWFQEKGNELLELGSSKCESQVDPEQMYERLAKRGLRFGPQFQSLKSVKLGLNEGICSVNKTIAGCNKDTRGKYVLHPIFLDVVFQSMISILGDSVGGCIPISIKSINYDPTAHPVNFDEEDKDICVYVQQQQDNLASDAFKGNVWMWSGKAPFLSCSGVQVTPIRSDVDSDMATTSNMVTTIKFEQMDTTCPVDPSTFFVPGSSSCFTLLKPIPHSVHQVNAASSSASSTTAVNRNLHPNNSISNALISSIPQPSLEILEFHLDYFLTSPSIRSSSIALILPTEQLSSTHTHPSSVNDLNHIIDWIRLLIQMSQKKSLLKIPPLFVVSVGGGVECSHAQNSSIIGLMRVLQSECPQLPSYLIDLDATVPMTQCVEELVDMITRQREGWLQTHFELYIRNNRIFSPLVIPTSICPITEHGEPSNHRWCVKQKQVGMLDSFYRTNAPVADIPDDRVEYTVYYAGLNYKDVLTSIGLLRSDAFEGGRTVTKFGVEGSGIVERVGKNITHLKKGDRVMSLLDNGLSTHSMVEGNFAFKVPDCLSLRAAAAIYVPYTTAFATLISIAKIHAGQTILVHGAAGGVGSAAVQLARSRGATVIVTASTSAKKEYSKSLGAHYAFNSRDTSFSDDVMRVTNGRGCDIILNCLSSRAMIESVRLLAPFGTFIEIGKTDAMNRQSIGIHEFLNNGTYTFFDLDRYFAQTDMCVEWIGGMLEEVKKGILNPLPTEVFALKSISEATRKLSSAKHIGKILLQFRDEVSNDLISSNMELPFVAEQYCVENGTYLIIGGTGGVGLRVAEWLCRKGAKHIVLLSRSGKIHPKDKRLFDRMQLCKSLDVSILRVNVVDKNELYSQLEYHLSSRPPLRGVIHSAMILHDSLIQNMKSSESKESVDVKAMGGWNVSEYAIHHDLSLDFFIVFSSISSVIGNIGQASYCMGNTALEGLIAHRHSLGLCGHVLNLGAVSDAGAIARDKSIVSNELKKEMITCHQIIQLLTIVLSHQPSLHPIFNGSDVSSSNQHLPNQLILFPFESSNLSLLKGKSLMRVVAKVQSAPKKSLDSMSLLKQSIALSKDDRIQFVAESVKTALSSIMGIDSSALRNDQALSSLGVDSIVAVEVKNRMDSLWSMSLPVFELTSGKSVGELISIVLKHVEEYEQENAHSQGEVNEEQASVDAHSDSLYSQYYDADSIQSMAPITSSSTTTTSSRQVARITVRLSSMGTGSDSDYQQQSQSQQPHQQPHQQALVHGSRQRTTRMGDTHLEEAVMQEISSRKSKMNISLVQTERFDWSTSKEGIETEIYLKQLPWNPYFFTQHKKSPTVSDIDGFSNCVNYTTYDYLGLCYCPKVIQATKDAIEKYGTSVSASRLAGGQIPLHEDLEKAVAQFLGVEDCIVMLGGHTCNVNTIKCLMNKKDLIVYDELSHNSVIEGAVYSGATRVAFAHNNVVDLERILGELRPKYEKVMICIEGVYSMDGDICHLEDIIRVKQAFNGILYVDEAHSIGVLGDTGRGVGEHFKVNMSSVDIWMGSLGKAFASAGGYIAGCSELIRILRYRSPGFVYSIGMPPAAAAAAKTALENAISESWRVKRLRDRTQLFKKLAMDNGLDIYETMKSSSAVVPVKCGATERCIEVMKQLRSRGVLVSAGMYPAVEPGNARLRFFISANHTEKEIADTVRTLSIVLKEICV